MNENKNDAITSQSRQSIKMDIMMFKDDILKDMRGIQRTLDARYYRSEENLTLKINKFETKINLFEQKVFELSNKINTDNKIREDVELLNKFKEETSDTLFKRRVKYNEFEKRMIEEIGRINNILIDSVIYPSIIGNSCRFKTFHEFMDYLLEEIGQFKIYQEKTGLDLGPFKKKIDNSIDALKIQLNNINNISKEYIASSIEQSEERIKSILKIYDDRLQDTRVENSHYTIGLEKKTEEMKKEINNLIKIKENLSKKLEKQKNENYNLEETFKYYNNEIISLNNKLNKMNCILKDLLSLYNNNNKLTKEKKGKIYSGVKQYIQGILDANQLTTMKNFKKIEDSSLEQNIRRNHTDFNKRNSVLPKKTFFSKNTTNFNYFNALNKDLNEHNNDNEKNKNNFNQAFNGDNNNKNIIGEEIKNKKLSRRSSYNFSNISPLKKFKFNDDIELKQNLNINKEIMGANSGRESKNNNSFKFINASNNSFDSKKDSIFNLSEETKNDNSSEKNNKKNQYIIKEEDENILSENSFIKNKEGDQKKDINIKELNTNNNNKKEKNIEIEDKDKNKNLNNNNMILQDKNKNNIKSKDEKKENKKGDIKINNNNYTEENNKDLKIKKIKDIPVPKTDIKNNRTKINYINRINLLRKSKESKNVPALEILNLAPDINKNRSQSSKKRNENLFYKNSVESKSYKNDMNNKIIINSYLNTNYQTNRENQNFPYINKENIAQKLDSISNTVINKTKLIKFHNNKNNNSSQTPNVNKNSISNRQKIAKLGSPDNLFSNIIIAKKNKRITKNNSFGMGYERSKEAKEIEKMFNKLQSYIPHYELNLPQNELAYKSINRGLKSIKSPIKYQ